MKLDLRAVEALEAVVKCGGFARAAKQLHRAQSAISHQIANLEAHLGVRVLSREDYRVRLTAAGEAVLAEGRRLLSQAEHLRSIARQFSQGWEPQLLVVIDGILPLDPALAALRTLAEEQVPTRIEVNVEFLRGVQKRFDRKRGDLMIAAEYVSDTYLHEEALPEMDCVLCVGNTHPLAGTVAVALNDLQDHVELSVQRSSDEQVDDRHLLSCGRRVYLPSFQTKREALLLGVGFGWMPLHLIWNELQSGQLRELDYNGGSRYRFTPRLVYRADRFLGPAGLRLVELIRCGSWPILTWPGGL